MDQSKAVLQTEGDAFETGAELGGELIPDASLLLEEIVDDLLVARLQAAAGNQRLVLIELAGRRHVEAASEVLLKLAKDPDAKIRAAAITAVGAIIPVKDLTILIARAVATSMRRGTRLPRDASRSKPVASWSRR